MDAVLKRKALAGFFLTPLVLGVPLFLSAWTLNYWEGWVFIAVFTGAALWHTFYIIKNAPGLLERRMRAGPTAEKRPAQRIIMSFMIVVFIGLFVVAGLDHRFGWSHVPLPTVLVADVMVVLSFAIFNIVCKQNTFASATIEVAEGQKVVSTGLYGLVRHPMYSGAILFSIAVPLALGSYWAALLVAAISPILLWRIVDEERFLLQDLPGYKEYCEKVRYRLIPGLY